MEDKDIIDVNVTKEEEIKEQKALDVQGNKNSLTAYSSSGKKEFTIDLAIGTPIAATNGQYLVIGEKNTRKDSFHRMTLNPVTLNPVTHLTTWMSQMSLNHLKTFQIYLRPNKEEFYYA